jgi:hypothetical protein
MSHALIERGTGRLRFKLPLHALRFIVLILPAIGVLAFAEDPALTPAVRINSIAAEVAQSEVRIEIDLSLPVASPRWLMIQGDSLVLDLPGATYEQDGKHFAVNRSGVRDVLVSVQQAPPLTRITITMSRLQPYKLSSEGNRISLLIGAHAQDSEKRSGAIPTARGGAIDRILRRAPKAPVYESTPTSSSAKNEKPSAPLPPIRFPDVTPTKEPAGINTTQGPPSATPGAEPAIASLAQNAPERAAPASPIREQSTVEDRSQNMPALIANAPASGSTERSLPVVRAAPVEFMAALGTASPPAAEPAAAISESAAVKAPAAAAEFRAAPAVPNADLRTLFHVKFVQQDVAYIDAGRTAGLAEGMKLLVASADANGALPNNISSARVAAELTVVGIAETSAVTQIHILDRDVVAGDVAYLSDSDLQALVQQQSLSSTRKYPAVISFSDDDDAFDQETRVMDVPRPPLPSVNRMEGRLGFDYFGTHTLDASQANARDLGIVLRANFTRIGGTYWNFLGYYRGTLDSASAASQTTLQETISRTYHLGLTYDNPTGRWVAGFGRLYLPWASSLDTLDGGYFGGRIHSGVITGIFAGSTPDPTSWNYNPNRQIGGAFVNFGGGSFEGLHYSSTSGAGISLVSWAVDRPFLFFENSLSYKRGFSIYSAVQADSPVGNAAVAAPGPGIGRSFFTTRWSPFQRLQLDFNHTYFREVPTFDATLIGTGLLDKYLFQGFSGGARLEIVKQIALYTELGRSNRTGDSSGALNKMYGITFDRIPWVELRADAHYSQFNSSFGSGYYRAASLSRTINERLRLEILAGDQAFISTLAGNQTAKFVTATMENDLGSFLFTQAGFTVYRGQQQNYNQWMLMLGYRFDSKWKRK